MTGHLRTDLRRRLRRLRSPHSSLEELFRRNEGRLIDRWVPYFEVYERHFDRFRGTAPTVLEIGVSHGGSLELWKRWFGPGTTVVGIDVSPRCAALSGPGIHVEIGEQQDEEFLRRVIEHHGPFDVVIDDGGHIPEHQVITFEILWDAVVDGGVYLVEDLHSNYWASLGGGLRRPGTFVEFAKTVIDDLSAFHSRSDDHVVTHWTRTVGRIDISDSIMVFERREHGPPVRLQTGRPVFGDLYGDDISTTLSEEHQQKIDAMDRIDRRLLTIVRSSLAGARRWLDRTDR